MDDLQTRISDGLRAAGYTVLGWGWRNRLSAMVARDRQVAVARFTGFTSDEGGRRETAEAMLVIGSAESEIWASGTGVQALANSFVGVLVGVESCFPELDDTDVDYDFRTDRNAAPLVAVVSQCVGGYV